ncbi:hypothetical protein CERSUDRAFT_107733, partial [Gelatoporia subvermispora B]
MTMSASTEPISLSSSSEIHLNCETSAKDLRDLREQFTSVSSPEQAARTHGTIEDSLPTAVPSGQSPSAIVPEIPCTDTPLEERYYDGTPDSLLSRRPVEPQTRDQESDGHLELGGQSTRTLPALDMRCDPDTASSNNVSFVSPPPSPTLSTRSSVHFVQPTSLSLRENLASRDGMSSLGLLSPSYGHRRKG